MQPKFTDVLLVSIRKWRLQGPLERCCLPTALHDVTSQTTAHRLFPENEIIKFPTGVLTHASVINERPIFTNYHSYVLIYVRLYMYVYTQNKLNTSLLNSKDMAHS